MRLVLVSFAAFAIFALVACPAPHVPKGPPPEYEDPPAPSWIDAGKSAEASTPSTLPVD